VFPSLDVSDFAASRFLTPLIKRRYNPDNRSDQLAHCRAAFLAVDLLLGVFAIVNCVNLIVSPVFYTYSTMSDWVMIVLIISEKIY